MYPERLLAALPLLLFACSAYDDSDCSNQVNVNRRVRLAGGQAANRFEFPFMTVVHHKTMICSGAIIADEWVLTAAHCFATSYIFSLKASDVYVIAGLINYNHSTNYTQVRHGTEVYIHPHFRSSVSRLANDDLALIRVKPFIMTDAVSVVLVSDKGFPSRGFKACTAIGWGEIDKPPGRQNTLLHKLKVSASVSAKACPNLTDWERAKVICLQQENGRGLCAGDSGGPLICHGELYGIAHQVYKEIRYYYEREDLERCGATGITHTYMFVCPYLNWIHKYVSEVPPMPSSCYI